MPTPPSPTLPTVLPTLERAAPSIGHVEIELIDDTTGIVVQRSTHNLLTTGYRQLVAQWLAGQAPARPSHIAIGTGADAAYDETHRDAEIDLKSTGADQALGQGFKLSGSKVVNAIHLYLLRIGTSAGNVYLEIQSDAAGVPSGVVLATSDAVSFNALETAYGWVHFDFATPPTLSGATQYHWALRSSGGYTYASGVTEVNLGVDQSSPGYADGAVSTWDGATWTAFGTASDAVFRVGVDPAIGDTTISGEVTRKALTSTTVQGGTAARLLTNFLASEAVGHHGMIGLLNAASLGTLVAATVVEITKTSSQRLNIYWIINVG